MKSYKNIEMPFKALITIFNEINALKETLRTKESLLESEMNKENYDENDLSILKDQIEELKRALENKTRMMNEM